MAYNMDEKHDIEAGSPLLPHAGDAVPPRRQRGFGVFKWCVLIVVALVLLHGHGMPYARFMRGCGRMGPDMMHPGDADMMNPAGAGAFKGRCAKKNLVYPWTPETGDIAFAADVPELTIVQAPNEDWQADHPLAVSAFDVTVVVNETAGAPKVHFKVDASSPELFDSLNVTVDRDAHAVTLFSGSYLPTQVDECIRITIVLSGVPKDKLAIDIATGTIVVAPAPAPAEAPVSPLKTLELISSTGAVVMGKKAGIAARNVTAHSDTGGVHGGFSALEFVQLSSSSGSVAASVEAIAGLAAETVHVAAWATTGDVNLRLANPANASIVAEYTTDVGSVKGQFGAIPAVASAEATVGHAGIVGPDVVLSDTRRTPLGMSVDGENQPANSTLPLSHVVARTRVGSVNLQFA